MLLLRKFSHSFVVPAGIDRVWGFYTDISHLEVITPPHMRLKVVKSSTGSKLQEGTEVWLEGNLVVKSAWHSRITELKPYVYVDEMLEGRFRTWKHTHAFRSVEGGTGVVDEIEFELRYGLLGRMLEGYAYKQLEKIFAHRKEATVAAFR
jgi:ligand-binding SRPBCC domain-containing protein